MATSLSIGIVSAGRVGSALGSALRAAGHTIVGAHAPSEASLDRLGAMLPGVPSLSVEEVARRAEVLLFAVPDDELGPLVEGLAKLGCFTAGQLAIHVAGRYGVSVLEPAARAGALTLAIHPAMTFTGTSLDVARLVGCPFARFHPPGVFCAAFARSREVFDPPTLPYRSGQDRICHPIRRATAPPCAAGADLAWHSPTIQVRLTL